MSEGWKEQIKLSVGHDPGYWDIDEVHSEIDRVYAQAEKADEYEAKAKAWDRVYEAFEKSENEHEFSNGVCTVMNEYESGGSDA